VKYRIKSRYANKTQVHAGSIEYVRHFASGYGREGGDRIVVVEFDPADVVCVPRDSDQQKIRCTQYKVIEEFKGVLSGYADCLQSEVAYTDEGSNYDAAEWDAATIFLGDEPEGDDDTCPACGELVSPEDNFCSLCGEKL